MKIDNDDDDYDAHDDEVLLADDIAIDWHDISSYSEERK